MSSRRLEILRAIVDEYVSTQEPVGSKSIADHHGLGISPATIRNEMAVLEEEGLITQPHTSAGRLGEPEELAATLIWLVSDASSYVTGITVPVDGGLVMP